MTTKLVKINTNASKIDLSNKDLTEIPREIFKCKNIKKLNLSNNNITNIPKEISCLTRLENLNLSENKVTVIYSKVFELKNLKTLVLNNNSIKKIPKQISNLRKLRILSLSGNQLTELPKEISEIHSIEKLNIANNPISKFPSEILALSSLTSLWVNNNGFEYFPVKGIADNLKRLKAIYCYSTSKNRIDHLDKNYLLLTKKKGNAINQLKLFAYKDELSSIKIESNQAPITRAPFSENMETKKRTKKNSIFISYSHKDKEWLERINTFLRSMQFDGIDIDCWDDTKIKAGQKWKEEITKALNEAYIAILIVSQDFLASDFIRSNELPVILESAEAGGTKVLPIIVRPCTFLRNKKLSQFQAVNSPAAPLGGMPPNNVEEVLVKLTYDLEEAIQEFNY